MGKIIISNSYLPNIIEERRKTVDYLRFENSLRATKRSNFYHWKFIHYVVSDPIEKSFKQQRKEKGQKKFSSSLNSINSENKCTERNNQKPNTWFRCGSEDNWIADCTEQENSENRVYWSIEIPKFCAYILTKIDKHRTRV